MNKNQIEYIESDLEGVPATLATLLNLNLQEIDSRKEQDERTQHVIKTLMFLHKEYKLIKK